MYIQQIGAVIGSTPTSTSVRQSTKSFVNFNEMWYAGRGRGVMNDGMQYDPIRGQGQGQGHEPLKGGNPSIFEGYLLPHLQWSWQMTSDS